MIYYMNYSLFVIVGNVLFMCLFMGVLYVNINYLYEKGLFCYVWNFMYWCWLEIYIVFYCVL